MQTLGEELISNEQVALIELVKNGYDADATKVIIRFAGTFEQGNGTIEVWDNGHGMSAKTVECSWMEIATAHRHRSPRSESNRRRVLGAKGIGRFAAARLGYRTEVVTRRVNAEEIALAIDWSAFDNEDAYLDDIPITWERRDPIIFTPDGEAVDALSIPAQALGGVTAVPAFDHGTLVRSLRLRHAWTRDDLNKVRRALSRLIPPPPPEELDVPTEPEFSIWLDIAEPYTDLAGSVAASEALAHPDYKIIGIVEPDGAAFLTYTDRNKSQPEEINVNLRSNPPRDTVSCGPLQLDIRVWNLEANSVSRLLEVETGARNISEIRALIRDSAGIALYRDGFRVQPYGEPGNDWLQLDPRRVNNPTLRLSNNQIAGFVYITADDNPELRDRSHREGLIDTLQFEDLKAVLIGAISEIEKRRYEARRPNADPEVQRERVRGIFDAFDLGGLRVAIAEKYPNDVELGAAMEAAEENVREGVRQVQEVMSRFSRLASLGTLVDVVLHDGRGALNRIAFAIRSLKKTLRRTGTGDAQLAINIEKVEESLERQREALDRLFKRIEPLSGRRRGRPRKLSLRGILVQAVEIMEHEAAAENIVVNVDGDDQTVTVDPGDVLQIMVNLLQNAIYWLSTCPEDTERRVTIKTGRADDNAVVIDVSDNGPGVPLHEADVIFDPYYSTKPNGVGLGLSIAGSIAKDFYDGDLALLSSGQLKGATFRVTLRRRIG